MFVCLIYLASLLLTLFILQIAFLNVYPYLCEYATLKPSFSPLILNLETRDANFGHKKRKQLYFNVTNFLDKKI